MPQYSRVFIAISRGQKLIISSMYSKETQVSRQVSANGFNNHLGRNTAYLRASISLWGFFSYTLRLSLELTWATIPLRTPQTAVRLSVPSASCSKKPVKKCFEWSKCCEITQINVAAHSFQVNCFNLLLTKPFSPGPGEPLDVLHQDM